jgi:hypothetical protein
MKFLFRCFSLALIGMRQGLMQLLQKSIESLAPSQVAELVPIRIQTVRPMRRPVRQCRSHGL